MRPSVGFFVVVLGMCGCARWVGIEEFSTVDNEGVGLQQDSAWAGTWSDDGGASSADSPDVPRLSEVSPDVSLPSDGGDLSLRDGTQLNPDASTCPALDWQPAKVSVFLPKGTGACSYPTNTLPEFVAGIDEQGFQGAHGCGTCLRFIAGTPSEPIKFVDVLVVDRGADGPGPERQINISRAAMNQVMPSDVASTGLYFAVVPCPLSLIQPTIRIGQKKGSNAQHLEFMVRDSRYPLKRVELWLLEKWVPMTLTSYNYWTLEQANHFGVYSFQLTNVQDETLQVNGITLTSSNAADGPLVDTKQQFTICAP
jgi:hypothetical protein